MVANESRRQSESKTGSERFASFIWFRITRMPVPLFFRQPDVVEELDEARIACLRAGRAERVLLDERVTGFRARAGR